MTSKKQNPITADKLKEVIATYQSNLAASMPKPAGAPTVGMTPIVPAELDQDAGGGYNSNGVFPQE